MRLRVNPRFIRYAATLVLLAGCAAAQTPFYLKAGDTVVFYGDSITDQRLYTTFAETFVVTRFPVMPVRFVHSGWGGDRVSGGAGGPIDVRLKRDVYAYHPSVITIMLGMNDGRYRPFEEGIFREYATGYEHIIHSLRSELPGIRITAIRPSPYDDVTQAPGFEGGYNAVLVRFGDYLKELAGKENLTVADLNAPIVAALQRAKAADAQLAKRILPDRVHPGPGGHLLMAGELLKAWGAPAIVTAVDIDTEHRVVERAVNTEVSNLTPGIIWKWTQFDRALPMPVDMKDKVMALAVGSSDFVQKLNQETLRVSGLAAGRYALTIDQEPAGTFTNDQLANGINLAVLPTPMLRQAFQVHQLTLQHNNIHDARWRRVDVPLEELALTSVSPALTSLDLLEAELVGRQRAAATPRPHYYELAPVN